MQRLMAAKRIWLLFFLVACPVYLYGLGNYPFVGPDEPRYAEVAREMHSRGDMVTPTLAGRTWFEKPALPYWMMMATYSLFGTGEGPARLGFALLGLMTALVIYLMAARAESMAGQREGSTRWLGPASGVAAASTAGLILFSHGVNFDIPLTFTITVSLACFLLFELGEEGRESRLLLAGFYMGVGAALLAKGLIAFILAFGVVSAYYALRRCRPGREVLLSLLWGVPLACLVAATWYVPVIWRNGWPFVDEFIIQHHFARYTSNKYLHPQPFWFYIPVMLLLALPWTLFLIETLAGARRWRWRAQDVMSKWRAFGLVWMLVPVLFFSASGSKLPGYILPALPGALMLVGERLARTLRGEGRGHTLRATGALLALAGVAAIFFVEQAGYAARNCAMLGGGLLIAGGLIALLFAGNRRLLAAGSIVCALFLMIITGLTCGIKEVSRDLSVASALEEAARRGYASTPVYHLHNIERTAEYYAAGRLRYGADGQPLRFEGVREVEDAARKEGGTILVIVPSEYSAQLTTYAPLETEIIEDRGGRSLVAVRVRE